MGIFARRGRRTRRGGGVPAEVAGFRLPLVVVTLLFVAAAIVVLRGCLDEAGRWNGAGAGANEPVDQRLVDGVRKLSDE